jgi:hypothetical protein|tara:strand:+ start:18 stop:194 length:177 start_codon:yes stop_codon:yes gene_type:complete
MKEYSIVVNLTENDLRDLQAKESFDWCFSAIKNDDGSNVDKNVLINVKITSGNDMEEE